jgi:hypothetical protein
MPTEGIKYLGDVIKLNITVFLDFVHRLVFQTGQNILEQESYFKVRCKGGKAHTQLGPLEKANSMTEINPF